jgi:hypothetical protein
MKINEDSVPQGGTAEQGIAEQEAPGMEAKSQELVEKGTEVYAKA